jgi:uncharacterized protein YndB with AHSA1/START domain
MIEVTITGDVGAPAAEVWALVADFNVLPAWLPGVTDSAIEGDGRTPGAVRRLEISVLGGRWAAERLESFDDDARSFSYSIVDTDLPLKDYLSTFRIDESGDGQSCTITWSARFAAKDAPDADAEGFVRGAYTAGIDNLKRRFAG